MPWSFITWIFIVIFLCHVTESVNYKRVCYYTDAEKIPVAALNLSVCTHVIHYSLGFNVSNFSYYWINPFIKAIFSDLVDARQKLHGSFKVLGVVSGPMEAIVANTDAHLRFASATVKFLRQISVDGVDFDWEYPDLKYRSLLGQMLRQLRKAFDEAGEPKLIISFAAGAPATFIDISYDIPAMAESLDMIDIMGYDMASWHGYWLITAHHSALYARGHESLLLGHSNVNNSVSMLIAKGMPPEKIVIGIPCYAHGWHLLTHFIHGVFSPAIGEAKPGLGGSALICNFIRDNSSIRIWDEDAESPYAYSDNRWYSFDDFQSVEVKAHYVKQNNLGGMMLWSLSADHDPENLCKTGHLFPMHSKVTEMLGTGI